jgi:hypothetical protein
LDWQAAAKRKRAARRAQGSVGIEHAAREQATLPTGLHAHLTLPHALQLAE